MSTRVLPEKKLTKPQARILRMLDAEPLGTLEIIQLMQGDDGPGYGKAVVRVVGSLREMGYVVADWGKRRIHITAEGRARWAREGRKV